MNPIETEVNIKPVEPEQKKKITPLLTTITQPLSESKPEELKFVPTVKVVETQKIAPEEKTDQVQAFIERLTDHNKD